MMFYNSRNNSNCISYYDWSTHLHVQLCVNCHMYSKPQVYQKLSLQMRIIGLVCNLSLLVWYCNLPLLVNVQL